MELSKSTIYTKEYFYSTLNGDDVEFRALTYKELETIQNKYTNKRNQLYISFIKTALLFPMDFSMLTSKDLDILYTKVLEVSVVTNPEMETIKASVEILMEESFKSDTFKSCKICQERGLDKQRNCPLLDKSTHDKMVFYIVGNKKLNECPMDGVNSPIVSDALRCHSILEGGSLPLAGGLYDQTMFFVEVSSLVKGIINSHQNKEMAKK